LVTLHLHLLIELSDDEAVAAAVMLPMVAADRMAPSVSGRSGGRALKRTVKAVAQRCSDDACVAL
jgi:hypothetical protein